MKTWAVCLFLIVITSPVIANVIMQDLNADGKLEKISFRDPWLYITESGRDLFYLRMFNCTYRFLDIDKSFSGKEIITVEKKTYPASSGYSGGSECSFVVTAYRWTEAKKYKELWLGEITRKKNETFLSDIAIKREWNRFVVAKKKAVKFVQAISRADWKEVRKLSDNNAGSSDYRSFQKSCKKFPNPNTWRAFTSPEDSQNRCFAVGNFTIVVSSTGVKMFR